MTEDISAYVTKTFSTDVCKAVRVGKIVNLTIQTGSVQSHVPENGIVGTIDEKFRPTLSYLGTAIGIQNAIGIGYIAPNGNIILIGSIYDGWYSCNVTYAIK